MRTLVPFFAPLLALTLGLTSPAPARAQAAGAGAPPVVGEELTVRYVIDRLGPASLRETNTVQLEVVSASSDALVGRTRDGLIVIDSRSIRSVRRRIGTKPASAPAMVLGSAAGFASGFLIGALTHSTAPGTVSARSAVDDGLVAGVLVGAPLGAFVAWLTSRSRPIYEDVDLGDVRPRVAVNPSGRVGFSLAVTTR